MANENDGLYISASLNIEQTENNIIKNDIPKINSDLAKDKNAMIKVSAELDATTSKANIQSQLNKTTDIKAKVSIDNETAMKDVNNVKEAVKNISKQPAKIKVDVDTSKLNKVVDVSKIKLPKVDIGNSLKDTFSNIEKSIKENVPNVELVTSEAVKNNTGNIESLVSTVKLASGQVVKLNYDLDETIKKLSLVSSKTADSGIVKQIADIDKFKSKYATLISQLKNNNSELGNSFQSRVDILEKSITNLDKNTATSKDLSQIERVYNRLVISSNKIKENLSTNESSYNKITNAVNNFNKFGNAIDDINNKFQQLKNTPQDASAKVDELKTKLESLQAIYKKEGVSNNWSQQYRELATEIKATQNEVTRLQLIEKSDNSSAKQQAHYYEKMYSEISRINQLQKQKVNAGELGSTEIQRQITNLEKRVKYDEKQIEKKKLFNVELERQKNELIAIGKEELKIANQRKQDKDNKVAYNTNLGVETAQSQLDTYTTKLLTSGSLTDEVATKLENLQTKLDNVGGDPKKLQEFNAELKLLKNEVTSINKIQKNLNDNVKAQQSAETLANSATNYKNNNTKALKQYGSELNRIIAKAKELAKSTETTSADVQQLRSDFRLVRSEIDATNQSGKRFFETIKEKVSKFVGWYGVSQLVMNTTQLLQNMVQNVVDIDTAMTDLKKVTDETDVGYQKFLDNAIEKSRELKINLSDVISQSAEWAKQGYNNPNDAMSLSQSSGIYSVVGEVDNATAVQDLTTVMKAFNVQASDSISIVDKLNNISNNYATTAGDIGTMLSNSASSLAAAGNNLDQAIAMGTTIREITGDASEAGNTLKVLSMRLRGAKTELEQAGESTDGMATSTSKLRDTIKGLTNVNGNSGFDIMADENTFKSTYEIMLGISKVWDKLTDVNKASLIETIAGKQRGNTVTALLDNMAQAQKIVEDSANSSGSAMQEYSKYLDSAQGKIAGFKNEFQILSQTAVDSDFLKNTVEFGTSLLEIVTNLIDKFGVLGGVIAPITATIMSVKNKGEDKMISSCYALP